MLGEIYIASGLAIFLAIFGWSEKIFGLSSKHLEIVLGFCEKTKLSYNNYIALMNLIKKEKSINPGRYAKKLLEILKKSNIQIGDKEIMKILKENRRLLRQFENLNSRKKTFFIVLFLFLFLGGSFLLYSEITSPKSFEPIFIAQTLLFILIIWGAKIYHNINTKESAIHKNLMLITTKFEGK